MQLRIGIIGTGAIGKEHIKRITNTITGARVVALTDIQEEYAKKIAEKHGLIFYKTGKDLIHSEEVDAIIIASSDPTHAEYVLECIKAKKYVLCEKPLATSGEDCLEIMDEEIKGGKKLVQVGFMRRYDRGYVELKEIIKSGKIGLPLMVHACHRNKETGSNYTTDMLISNSGIHEIDVMRWLLEEEYETAQAFSARQNQNASSETKDPQMMLLKTKSGVRIDVEINMNSGYGYDIQCEVVGEKGIVRLSDPHTIEMKLSGMKSYEIYPDWMGRFDEAYNIEIQEWINSIKEGGPIGPDSWDGYVACVVADTLIKSRKNGEIEKILLESKPEFYC